MDGTACLGGLNGATNNAGIDFLRVADDACFMNVFAGQADVGGSGYAGVLFENTQIGLVCAEFCDLSTFLRGVIFIGKAALRLRFDFKRVGLGAIRCGDQFIMGDRSGSLRWFGGSAL